MNIGDIAEAKQALDIQLRHVMNAHFRPFIEKPNYYQFRCNICGDSKRSKYKKRAYIVKYRDRPWVFKCHNGQCQTYMRATEWLKQYFPSYHRQYVQEAFRNKDNPAHKWEPPKETKDDKEERAATKSFVPILRGKGAVFEKAKDLCRSRNIPEAVWHKWFVATDGPYANRLIIPFYEDKTGRIHYYQGRALLETMDLKYLSRKAHELESIYNYYNVDSTRPVTVLEGPIDSIFVENSVAVTGLKVNDIRLNRFPDRRYLVDYDESGREMSKKLLKKGRKVFVWRKFLAANAIVPSPNKKIDVNDVILMLNRTEPFSVEELDPFFTSSPFDGILL